MPQRVTDLFVYIRSVAAGEKDDVLIEVSTKYPKVGYESRLHTAEMKENLSSVVAAWSEAEQVPHEEPDPSTNGSKNALAESIAGEGGYQPAHDGQAIPMTAEEIAEASRRLAFYKECVEKELLAYFVGVLQSDSHEAMIESLESISVMKGKVAPDKTIDFWLEAFAFKEDHSKHARHNPFFHKRSAAVPGFDDGCLLYTSPSPRD